MCVDVSPQKKLMSQKKDGPNKSKTNAMPMAAMAMPMAKVICVLVRMAPRFREISQVLGMAVLFLSCIATASAQCTACTANNQCPGEQWCGSGKPGCGAMDVCRDGPCEKSQSTAHCCDAAAGP